jgi:hypothetical protein
LMRLFVVLGLFSVSAAILAACGTVPPPVGSLRAEACQIETGVEGSYNYDGSEDIPEVQPLPGNSVLVAGTAEGAARLNACIRAKAASGQTDGRVNRPSTSQPAPTASGTDAFVTQCMFEVQVPAGGGRQAGIDAMNACISRKAAAAGIAPAPVSSVTTALPSVAGVPQTVTTQTNGTTTTETFTYGTPPTAAVPASEPARAPICNLQMTGGTGYSCAIR